MTNRAYVAGWGAAVPDGIVTNADLEARLDTIGRVDRRADRHPRTPRRLGRRHDRKPGHRGRRGRDQAGRS